MFMVRRRIYFKIAYCLMNTDVIYIHLIFITILHNVLFIISECSKHCSLCYNETECYECTQGYFLNELQECESKFKSSNSAEIIEE